MNNRIQIKTTTSSKVGSPLLKADMLTAYTPVRAMMNSTLQQAARLATHAVGAKVAAVCIISSNSVRLMTNYGLGDDRLARSLPKDFSWFAPAKAMFSSDQGVVSQIQGYLGTQDYKFVISVPVRSHLGHVMGSILILDHVQRNLENPQLEVLSGIAELAMESINAALFLQPEISTPVQSSLEAALMQAKESVVVFDLNGVVTAWNAGAEEMYGYSSEKMIGQSILKIIPNTEQRIFMRTIQEQKVVAPQLVTRLHQSGFRIQVRSSLQIIRDAAGNATGVLEFSGLSAEPSRAAIIDRFQNLVQHLPMCFLQTDLSGILTFIEGSILGQYQRGSDELLGVSVFEIFADQPEIQAVFNTALQGQTVHRTVSWRERSYEVWLVPTLNHSRLTGCSALVVDVSQQVDSEHSLQNASRRIEQLLDTLPILVIAIDLKGNLTLLEGKGIKHFGGQEKVTQLIGMPLSQILSQEPVIENLIESALAGDEFNVSFDFRGMNINVFVRPVFEHDVLIGANAIVLDTSDISKATEDKRTAIQELVHTQSELAQQQAFAKMVLETIEQGVTVNDTSGLFEYVSPVYAQMLGYEPEELIGRSPIDLVVNKAEMQIALQERNEGWRNTNRYQAIRKDGSLVWIEVTGYARRNSQGEIVGGIGIIRDIGLEVDFASEIKVIQAKLKAEQEFANKVTSVITQGVVTIDANGLVIYANQAVANMMQCSIEALIGIEALLLAPEAERTEILKLEWQKIVKGEVRTYQHNMIPQDGQLRRVEVTVHPNLSTEQISIGSVMFLTDITNQQHLETSIEREREFALSIAQSLQTGLIVTDTNLNFEYINPAFTALFGYTLEDLRGKSPAEIVHPDDSGLLEQVAQERQLGQRSTYRYRIFHKNGEVLHVEASGYPRMDTQGKLIGTIATMYDITEQLTLEQAAQQARRAIDRESRNAVLVANAISDGLLFLNQAGLVEYANPGVLKMLGYTSRKEILGLPAFTWVIPEDMALFTQETQRVQQGQIRSYRMRIKRITNDIITIEGTSYPRLENGVFQGVIVVLHDISLELEQQKRQEEFTQTLRQSEYQFRELFEQSVEQTKRLELIDTIRNAASSASTTHHLIQEIVSSISQTLGVPMVSIYLLEKNKLVLQHAVGYEKTIKAHSMDGRGVMVRSARTNQIMLIADASTEADFVHLSGKIQSELCVPITNNNHVLGVINLESTEKNAFSEADANLLLQIAERISDKIEMTRVLEELRALEQQRNT